VNEASPRRGRDSMKKSTREHEEAGRQEKERERELEERK